ncbi:MAG: class I SAM-dependent methyltransferase [Phycisphaeraceae bacterium]|nr:class I SAM-dependent methyltransferase [Phycisphaeraceae bacterium]
MRPEQLNEFIDPETGRPLRLDQHALSMDGAHVREGRLVTEDGSTSFPIVRGIPRFVGADNYAGNFGLQWQKHAKLQLDSYNGSTLTRERFFRTTGWPERMDGDRILEAGSGAGRFSEIMLSTGARLSTFDFSQAVQANYANNGEHPNFCIFQGDIYRIPFPAGSFDRVFCLGVLQHTPDVRKSFAALARMVRPGGSLSVDVYPKMLRTMLHWKYVMRPITTRMKPEKLYRFVEWYAPKLIPLARFMRSIAGRGGARLVPILEQSNLGVDLKYNREWTILDTYDALSATYDFPQTDATMARWYAEEGFVDVKVHEGACSGRRPESPSTLPKAAAAHPTPD